MNIVHVGYFFRALNVFKGFEKRSHDPSTAPLAGDSSFSHQNAG